MAGVGIQIGADVQLHNVVVAVVDTGHLEQECALVLVDLMLGQLAAAACLGKDALYLGGGVICPVEVGDAVVTDGGAGDLLEILQTLFQCGEHLGKAVNGLLRSSRKLCQISSKIGVGAEHGLIGAEGGDHAGEHLFLVQSLVVAQVVDGVFGGGDQTHIAVLHAPAAGHVLFGDKLFGAVINFLCIGCGQGFVDVEVALQLQCTPDVDGIAHQLGQNFGKLHVLFVVAGITGDVLLVDAKGAHTAPLVVVAAQPHLAQIFKLLVLGDLHGLQMAMVIDDRHMLCILVVEHLAGLIGEEQLFAETIIHNKYPPKMPTRLFRRWVGSFHQNPIRAPPSTGMQVPLI